VATSVFTVGVGTPAGRHAERRHEEEIQVQHQSRTSAWRGFWERGTWWKGVVGIVIYLLVFYGVAAVIGLSGRPLDTGTASGLLLTFALPVLVAGLVLLAFAWSVGWLRELFGPQAIRGGRWMWIAVAVVLGTNLVKYLSVDYAAAGAPFVAAWIVTTICIGFTEELASRGLAVTILRKAGYSELAVALVSSVFFAAMHAVALLNGMSALQLVGLLLYTFCFGLLMYVTLRVTGSLIGPMVVHATTDAAGALVGGFPNAASPLLPLTGMGNFVVIGCALILVFFIRGRSARPSTVVPMVT
jgi:uncharacterized protein